MGLKAHKPSSLHQTKKKHCLLQDAGVSNLTVWKFFNIGKVVTLRSGCLNWVTKRTLQSQFFLNKLWWEHLGWTTSPKQEWGLFMLDHLLLNMASMQRKEHQRHSQGSHSETSDTAPKHPSVQALLGSPDAPFLKIAEQVYRGSMWLHPVFSAIYSRMSARGLQSETRSARPSSRGQRHSIAWACYPSAAPQGTEAAKQLKEDPPQNSPSWEGIPILGAGISWGGISAPLLNAQAGTSHPPLVPHDPILLMSSSAALWKT